MLRILTNRGQLKLAALKAQIIALKFKPFKPGEFSTYSIALIDVTLNMIALIEQYNDLNFFRAPENQKTIDDIIAPVHTKTPVNVVAFNTQSYELICILLSALKLVNISTDIAIECEVLAKLIGNPTSILAAHIEYLQYSKEWYELLVKSAGHKVNLLLCLDQLEQEKSTLLAAITPLSDIESIVNLYKKFYLSILEECKSFPYAYVSTDEQNVELPYDFNKVNITLRPCRSEIITKLLSFEVKFNSMLRDKNLTTVCDVYEIFSKRLSLDACDKYAKKFIAHVAAVNLQYKEYQEGTHTYGGSLFGNKTVNADKVLCFGRLNGMLEILANTENSDAARSSVYAFVCAWQAAMRNIEIVVRNKKIIRISLGKCAKTFKQIRGDFLKLATASLDESCDVQLLDELKIYASRMRWTQLNKDEKTVQTYHRP